MTSFRALLALVLMACTTEPAPAPEIDPTFRNEGIEGANCAGATPAMAAPDGTHPFPSVIAYYHAVLQAFWTKVGNETVLHALLPPAILAANVEFGGWLGKTIGISRLPTDPTTTPVTRYLGYGTQYYPGMFGFLIMPAAVGTGCTNALTAAAKLTLLLAHTALAQAGVCGYNEPDERGVRTPKHYQVNGIGLMQVGNVFDARRLVPNLAVWVENAPWDRCILPWSWNDIPRTTPRPSSYSIPCRLAWHPTAVLEGFVMAIPSPEWVAGVPVRHRPFTAAGTELPPAAVRSARIILQDPTVAVAYAIGFPMMGPPPAIPDPITEELPGPFHVQFVGQRIGPKKTPSTLLLADERTHVDLIAGRYEQCCHIECAAPIQAAVGTGSNQQCKQVCIEEKICETGIATEGMAALLSGASTSECNGNCPEPEKDPPAATPTCTVSSSGDDGDVEPPTP